MRIYQFYSALTGNIGIQILQSGRIKGVTWSAHCSSAASGSVIAELSYAGQIQNVANNPNGIISVCRADIIVATAASIVQASLNFFDGGIDCPVKTGDIIYLNCIVAVGGSVRALLKVVE